MLTVHCLFFVIFHMLPSGAEVPRTVFSGVAHSALVVWPTLLIFFGFTSIKYF